MRILVRFQQNSTAPLQDTKKSVLIDSPLDRQNDRAFDSDDGAARVSSTLIPFGSQNFIFTPVANFGFENRPFSTHSKVILSSIFKINFRPEEKVDCVE